MRTDGDDRLARLGHDLANRLAVMAGHMELVRDEMPDRAGATSSLDVLDRTIDEMRQLTTQWLGPRTPTVPPTAPARVDVAAVLGELVQEHSAIQAPARIRLVRPVPAGAPAMVRGSRTDVKLAFENVLSNALKYSTGDQPVTVTFAVAEGLVLITFRDHGIGIEPRDLPHVQTPHFRTERARNSPVAGSGLGLATSADVVRAHGGRMEVRSVIGRGTTVRIELPVAVLESARES